MGTLHPVRKRRIVFVDHLLLTDTGGLIQLDELQPPLGLISLLAVLERDAATAQQRGVHPWEGLLYDPKLQLAFGELTLDGSLYRRMADELLAFDVGVVGFSTLGANFICVLKVAQYIKRARPDVLVVLGGPHATVLDTLIMKHFPCFDVIVRNEAEMKLIPLLRGLEQGDLSRVMGVTYRLDGQVVANPGEPVIDDLDQLPAPAYHHYPLHRLGLRECRIEVGRGCPFNCSFCSTAQFFSRKYRLKSARKIVAEMDYLYENFGISIFHCTHDLFTVNKKKVVEFCHAVAPKGYRWTCSARTDCLDEPTLSAMASANCQSIYYGVEAGSTRMQQLVRKDLDLDEFRRIYDLTTQLGINCTVSMITGYPQELQADQAATLDLMGECFARSKPPTNVQMHLLTPEPGTEMYTQFVAELAYDGHVSDFNFPNLEGDDGAVMAAHPDVFVNHHYYKSVLPRERHIFVTSVYPILYRLGHEVLAHLTWRADGRFSRVIEDLYEWWQTTSAPNGISPAGVLEFFQKRYGITNYITSLVRYQQQAVQLTQRPFAYLAPEEATSARPVEEHTTYRLSPRVAVLEALHDGPALLQFLDENPRTAVPEGLQQAVADRVMLLAADRRTVLLYTINDATKQLLQIFTEPQTLAQVAQQSPDISVENPHFLNFFSDLISEGLLEPIS